MARGLSVPVADLFGGAAKVRPAGPGGSALLSRSMHPLLRSSPQPLPGDIKPTRFRKPPDHVVCFRPVFRNSDYQISRRFIITCNRDPIEQQDMGQRRPGHTLIAIYKQWSLTR